MSRPRKTGSREPNGRIRRKLVLDRGTPELARHCRLEERETTRAGEKAVRDASECLLDVLLRDGALGKGQKAEDRHGAGIWLRGVHENATRRKLTGAYGETIPGEMTDQQAAAARFCVKVMRKMGLAWGIVRPVCIDNVLPDRSWLLTEALDKLHKVRVDNTRRM